ncbi:protein takeout-like [Coccinella septempunctata]|uniref:protein takeout-like n=1 Tax=Coccinella septempunctata TaxID=41139 RepID=UPI001D065B98|nr:protein takeout-like [Coccinella septempunctata]
MQFLFVFVISIQVFGFVATKKLPNYITYCHRDDPQLNECVAKAIHQVKPHLAEGIPEFQLPSMNPLFLPEASLESGENFKCTFKNIEVFYADEFILKNVDIDLKNNRVEMVIVFPRLRIKSIYAVSGKLLILQLDGSGPSDGNFTNVEARMIMNGSRYTKNNKEYMNFDKNELKLNVGRPILNFENLFGQNEELNVQTNRIINENIEGIIEELSPVLNKVISEFIFGLIGRIFARFSLEELFPK